VHQPRGLQDSHTCSLNEAWHLPVAARASSSCTLSVQPGSHGILPTRSCQDRHLNLFRTASISTSEAAPCHHQAQASLVPPSSSGKPRATIKLRQVSCHHQRRTFLLWPLSFPLMRRTKCEPQAASAACSLTRCRHLARLAMGWAGLWALQRLLHWLGMTTAYCSRCIQRCLQRLGWSFAPSAGPA
jgi:hypothetical protein